MRNRLQEFRKARNLSQSEIAQALEISRQAVSGFESGKFTPSLEMAFKIAQLLEVRVEEIFLAQEKNYMQTLVDGLIQWLPIGERFTDKAIAIITVAQEKAASCHHSQVEPKHLLYGLLFNLNTTGRLLRSSGLTLEALLKDIELMLNSETEELLPLNVQKIEQFSIESKYILESALQLARLQQSKQIEPEHLLLGLTQLVQLGNSDLDKLFQKMDIKSLQQELFK